MNEQSPALVEVSLKILLKNKNGEYLLLNARDDNPNFRKKYDLPGGRMCTAELNHGDFHQLIKREVKEEIGSVKYKLRLNPVSLSKFSLKTKFKPSRDGVLYILFEAEYQSGEIKISDEHIGYKWTKLNKGNIKKLFHPVLQSLIINYLDWN